MSLWSRLGEKTGARENGPPAGAFSLEILESRLLLDADLVGTQPLSCLGAALDTQALVVDLDQAGAGSRESGSCVIATLPALSGQAGLTAPADPSLQSGTSDLGPVGQDDAIDSEAGLTADLNLQSPGGSSPTRSGAAGVVLDGTADRVLSDTPEGCPGRQNGADEPVTVQAPAEAAPRGPPAASATTVNQIIFIDSAVDPGFQLQNAALPGVALVVLDTGRDGIRQITDILSPYRNVSAIHILSHSAPGQVSLGTATLSPSALNGYADDLVAWGASLAEAGDILLYGCSAGAGPEGEAVIRGLAGLTGADVAASTDPTGPAEGGGNWVLETATGPVEGSLSDAGIIPVGNGGLDYTLGLTDSVVVGPDCAPELLEAKRQGILHAMDLLVSFTGYDIDPALAPVTFHLQGDEFYQYTPGMTGFWTIRNGKGHVYLFDLEKTNRSLPFTPENAVKLEDQLLPVHEAMHGWFRGRINNYGVEEPFCKLTSFYVSDALGQTPDPITWFRPTTPYPDKLMYDLGVLGMNEPYLGQVLNRTGYDALVKGGLLTVPEFADIVSTVLGKDAVPAFVAAGLMPAIVTTVSASPSSVPEDGSTNLVYTFTRSVADSSPLTVNFSVGGTATYSMDYTQTGAASYTPPAGTVTIPAGQATAQVTVNPTADSTVEPNETVILTVTPGTGYMVGTPSVATGTIQNDDGGPVNLALGKTAVASTTYSGLPAANVTDGNLSSRWSSLFSDSQWLYVDLGSAYTINRVVLRWESAYGRGYKLQVSDDASIWSDAYSTTTGDGGVDDIMLGTPASGRYVRMLGTQRATVYGYSLWEFEVYGGGGGAPVVTVGVAPSVVAEDGSTNLVYTFTRSVADSSALTVSFSVGGTATYSTDYTPTGAASFTATSGTVTIAASQTTAQVTVDPTADATVEPDETVILTVTAGAGYTVGTPSVSTGTIQNDEASGNLASGRAATASTSYSGLPPSNATDGNLGTRWSSQFSDNEWIYVDLGSAYTINRVVLRWETAYGRGYKLQVSSNASVWSDVYSTTTGDGGVDDITLAGSGRYVRMLGTQRATMYGYSLWEFEVYGPGGSTNHAPAVSSLSKSVVQDTPLPFATADFAGAFTDPDASDSLQKIKVTSLPGHGELTLNSTAVSVDQEIATAEIGMLVYTPNSGYTGSDSFQWNGSDGSLYAATDAAVNLSINAEGGNLALGKTAVSSTNYTGLPPSNATDGNVNSRWSSQFSDSEWIYVDLGSVFTINRVVLRWEAAYGRGYQIQVSGDASTWSEVYSTTTGDGGVDDITLAAPASGRYVRLLGTQRATVYGYSLYELEVYAGAVAPNLALHRPAMASTSYSGLPAANATDGNTASRWSSQFSDSEWIYVDLGSVYTINQVVLRWPDGYGCSDSLCFFSCPYWYARC